VNKRRHYFEIEYMQAYYFMPSFFTPVDLKLSMISQRDLFEKESNSSFKEAKKAVK
jgi:hypothetical protein